MAAIEFNPLIVIAAAAIICAIVSFIVARRTIRGRLVVVPGGPTVRVTEEQPELVDLYVEPGRKELGTTWQDIMPIAASTPREISPASGMRTTEVEIAVAILMPSPNNQSVNLNNHTNGRPMSSSSSTSSKEKEKQLRGEEWMDHADQADDSIDYSIGLTQVLCHHRHPLEFA